ncbi:MAG: DNA mismatch repair endonuclease MutL, partial [Candidatus Adiutrix sp.]|nr:DNA mismatch repair endonuclease MutL [Candidatus Adiutrix sp.]
MNAAQTPNMIKLLPDALINRIAAGEVVERPAAVLKELVENSLDAGADRIDIEVENGGKKLIRVTDNGRGMGEEDLFLCLERHATSKLAKDADLMRIATLGFRGEALPSIGSVARLTITSALAGGEGHAVTVEGGRLMGLKPAPANRGTVVEVADLFRYVPARRKFLKSDHTESAHLLEVAQCYALSRPGLSLSFKDNGREALSVEARHDFKTRVYRVLGRAAAESLRPFEFQAEESGEGREALRITGWLGGPEKALRSTANMFVYVLGRPVRDRLLNRAAADGYGRILPPGHWPTAIIFIDIDPEAVDVNVHPAKAEVRFRRPGAVFSALSLAVSRTVGQAPPPPEASGALLRPLGNPAEMDAAANLPWDTFEADASIPPRNPAEAPEPPAPHGSAEADAPPHQPWDTFEADEILQSRGPAKPDAPIQSYNPAEPHEPASPPWMVAAPLPPSHGAGEAGEVHAAPETLLPGLDETSAERAESRPAVNFEELRPLAQLYNSYILAEGSRGLYVIDQHAAHERILYNQLKEKLTQGLPGQSLLFPDSMDLPPRQALAAEKLIPHLAHIGFDLRHFGDRTFVLQSAPAILGGRDPWPPLLEML